MGGGSVAEYLSEVARISFLELHSRFVLGLFVLARFVFTQNFSLSTTVFRFRWVALSSHIFEDSKSYNCAKLKKNVHEQILVYADLNAFPMKQNFMKQMCYHLS